jgi:hypothetical protein
VGVLKPKEIVMQSRDEGSQTTLSIVSKTNMRVCYGACLPHAGSTLRLCSWMEGRAGDASRATVPYTSSMKALSFNNGNAMKNSMPDEACVFLIYEKRWLGIN